MKKRELAIEVLDSVGCHHQKLAFDADLLATENGSHVTFGGSVIIAQLFQEHGGQIAVALGRGDKIQRAYLLTDTGVYSSYGWVGHDFPTTHEWEPKNEVKPVSHREAGENIDDPFAGARPAEIRLLSSIDDLHKLVRHGFLHDLMKENPSSPCLSRMSALVA